MCVEFRIERRSVAPDRGILARACRLPVGSALLTKQPDLRESRAVGAVQQPPLEGPPGLVGNWRSVHKCFTRWAKSGVWKKIFQVLLEDSENRYVIIDSPIVRAH